MTTTVAKPQASCLVYGDCKLQSPAGDTARLPSASSWDQCSSPGRTRPTTLQGSLILPFATVHSYCTAP